MRNLILPLFILLICVSCGKESYPPIVSVPTYTYRYGEFVWHELGCTDMAQTKEFYSGLFGWSYEDYEIPSLKYSLITYNGQYMGGIVESAAGGMNQWVGAISVKKPKALMDAAVDNGAMELVKSTTLPGRGTMGLMRDPQGATFAVINSFNGDPEAREAGNNEWIWMELWSGNTQSSAVFYEQFYAFSNEESTVDSKPYWVFEFEDASVAGMEGLRFVVNIDGHHEDLYHAKEYDIGMEYSYDDVLGFSAVYSDINDEEESFKNLRLFANYSF